MIPPQIIGYVYGAVATIIVSLAVMVGIDRFFIVPHLRAEISMLTVQRDTANSDKEALQAAQEVQNKAVADLVALAHSKDAAADKTASDRIARARKPQTSVHNAEELNTWLNDISQQR